MSTKKVANIIEKFYMNSLKNGNPEFFAEELRELVASMINKLAPGTTDRILRQLRQQNVINYVVLNRAQSLYKFIPVTNEIDLGNEVAEVLTPVVSIDMKAIEERTLAELAAA